MRARVKICKVARTWILDGRLWQQLECGDIVAGRVSAGGTIARRRQCAHCTWARYLELEKQAKERNEAELERIDRELGIRR